MKNRSVKISAVALSFDPELNSAPQIVAKGEGILAEKILEIAEEHGREIISDSQLHDLLNVIPVGKEIPDTLYRAIAAIYAYFYGLNDESKRSRDH